MRDILIMELGDGPCSPHHGANNQHRPGPPDLAERRRTKVNDHLTLRLQQPYLDFLLTTNAVDLDVKS